MLELQSSTAKEDFSYRAIPFVAVHVAAVVSVVVLGFSLSGALLCAALYVLRMFAITAGYHRYFAHRSYRTTRGFQFVLALLGGLAAQKGALWWAGHHRAHHKHSDTEQDVHSPLRRGFSWAHTTWFLCHRFDDTQWDIIKDFARYPELRWLNRNHLVPPLALGLLLLLTGGWESLVWGGLVSTVFLWHGTFSINSLAHLIGRQRYPTEDQSKNSLLLSMITLGEGWHNNHHHYPHAANPGFFWWEIDPTYWLLRALAFLGVIWDLRVAPERAVEGKLVDPPVGSDPLTPSAG